ncbi:SH3 domain-containing kinase-binding protein 1 [Pholidichthys leucotaenia]
MAGVQLPQMLLYVIGAAENKVTLMMEERQKNQREEFNSATHQESTEETSQNGSILPEGAPKPVPSESFSSLLPKALSAVLHPALPPGLLLDSRLIRNSEGASSPKLEQLHTQLRDLRAQFEQMKSQHNKEIKILMSELDEEKRIRLTLQMEIQRMKKHMSK